MTLVSRSAVIHGAGDGSDVSRHSGQNGLIKAAGKDTGGRLAVVEVAHPPLVPGPPAHRHPASDEAIYMLAGELRVLIGDEERRVGPGGFVLVPGGTVHTFATAGDQPARFLTLLSPAGFEEFFMAVADAERAADRGLTIEELVPLASRYDWEIVGPPLH